MKLKKGTLILAGIVILAVLIGGCTSSKPAATPSTGVTQAAQPAATTSAPVAPSSTLACPDANQKGIWDGTWDTRWMGYASNHDITSISFTPDGSPDSWNGINSPPPTEVKMTQKCWDVTGTINFALDPPCSGTLTGTIDKNQLSGSWKTGGCQPEEGSTDGKFAINMAPDNKTWTGKIIGKKWLDWCTNCPPNWAGKKVS